MNKLPFHGGHCYACGQKASGLRDRRSDGKSLEPACTRHADPTIEVFNACMYCSEPVRSGSIDVDSDFAHKSCHREACI